MLWARYKSVILATPQLPKLELKNYSKNVLTQPMFLKELRSWRLNNLIDYISGKRKARKDLTKPKLKILSEVKGKYKSKINQTHTLCCKCLRRRYFELETRVIIKIEANSWCPTNLWLNFEFFNLFVTSKNEFFNSPILEFKVLQNVFKIKKQGLNCFFKVINKN